MPQSPIIVSPTVDRRTFFRVLSVLAFGGLIVSGSGCAQQEPAAQTSTSSVAPSATASSETPSAGSLKVGLVTPGKISDKGWSQSAYEGLQKIKTELGAEMAQPVEGPAQAQVETVLRDLAQQGCTIVFGHASEYDDAAVAAGKEFPKTTYVVMGGKSSSANVIPIQLQSSQATYLAGMLAGGMTKTGKIGLVGGIELPIIKQAFAAFEKGAKTVRPDVKVTTTYIGNFEDVAKAKQQAQALLEAGADVLMHNANDAGPGVFQAVTEKKGAMVIGANADQSDQATDQNLGSFILDVPTAMTTVARNIKDGKTDGKPFAAGLKDKAVGFVYNPGFKGTISDDLKAKIKKAQDDMIAGTLNPDA